MKVINTIRVTEKLSYAEALQKFDGNKNNNEVVRPTPIDFQACSSRQPSTSIECDPIRLRPAVDFRNRITSTPSRPQDTLARATSNLFTSNSQVGQHTNKEGENVVNVSSTYSIADLLQLILYLVQATENNPTSLKLLCTKLNDMILCFKTNQKND